MKTAKHFLVSLFICSALVGCSTTPPKDQAKVDLKDNKAVRGLINMTTGPLEVPKNIINLTNTDGGNIFFGIVGGVVKGSLDSLGRMGAGVADFLTAPLDTKPITSPEYVWDDFDADTTYGKVFRLKEDKSAPNP